MTIGRNSITTVITVNNNVNPEKPYKITVQADKNYRICDMSPRVGEILTDFQGRQLAYQADNDIFVNATVADELEKALETELNTIKD